MKVSIIGGGGLVGSCTAFALQTGKIVREIALLDVNANLVAGQGTRPVARFERHGRSGDHVGQLRAHTLERRDLHHGRAAPQTRRKPLGPGQSECRSVRRHPRRDQARRLQARCAGSRRFQPGRRAHLSGRFAVGLANQPGDRPGNAARHHPLSQPDRGGHPRAADAGQSVDPGRTRRQHGADLVERHGGRLAAGALCGLDLGPGG